MGINKNVVVRTVVLAGLTSLAVRVWYGRLPDAIARKAVFRRGTSSTARQGWLDKQPPLLVTLKSGKRNHLFYVGEPVTFFPSGQAATSYEVRDYYGERVDQGPLTGARFHVSVRKPGWYKIYLYGTADQGTPWNRIVGGTTFVLFRPDTRFPKLPATDTPGGKEPSSDEVMRGITGMGPQRLKVEDASKPDEAIARLEADVALDKEYYLPFDPARGRALLVAFPNGTQNIAGVRRIVERFKDTVRYWEPRNEPNFSSSGADFARGEMKTFYETVKGVNPSLRVLGPGTVSISPGTQQWIEDFLKAGGGASIDGFSFHAYNNVNGDLYLTRLSLDTLSRLLTRYGVAGKEKWQTEQGYFAAVYGAYEPRHQGRWTMLQMMVYEQYGIPKEHNHLWYDKSHGFWDVPAWWENDDGSLNPAAPLMRVWSEELYGTRYVRAYDLGTVGNKLYLASLFEGSGRRVAAFLSAGGTGDTISLAVRGRTQLHLVSAFGRKADLPVRDGHVQLPIGEVPVYVELAPGQDIGVEPLNWGPNLAQVPGVTVIASGSPAHPVNAGISNSAHKLVNGVMETFYWNLQDNDRPWMSNITDFPGTVEVRLTAPARVNHVVVYAAVPWQWEGSLLDYELQYDNNGQWTTIERIQEPSKVFKAFTPATRTTVDQFYSDRCVFRHDFQAVTTQKLRLVVHNATFGGGATAAVAQAGGQTGPHQITLREIEVYAGGNTRKVASRLWEQEHD